MTDMEWTRAHRGRVWHITFGGPILCNPEIDGWEKMFGMPPRGGTPCQPCVAAIKEAASYADSAVLASQQADAVRKPEHVHHVPQTDLDDLPGMWEGADLMGGETDFQGANS